MRFLKRPTLLRMFLAACLVASLVFFTTGCTRRTITITSEPEGALVWLNGREVGRTPVSVDFLYYGVYDVQLAAEGHEPLLTSGQAPAPWWDSIPVDLLAEAVPGDRHSRIAWHYRLQARDDDPSALTGRARDLRDQLGVDAPSPASQPVDSSIPTPQTQAPQTAPQ